MTICSSCNGTGITPYSVMQAGCIVCNGTGILSENKIIVVRGVVYEGDIKDYKFTGSELFEYELFEDRHICSDGKRRSANDVVLSERGTSGIGISKFVTCMRCGCAQEITNYSEW